MTNEPLPAMKIIAGELMRIPTSCTMGYSQDPASDLADAGVIHIYGRRSTRSGKSSPNKVTAGKSKSTSRTPPRPRFCDSPVESNQQSASLEFPQARNIVHSPAQHDPAPRADSTQNFSPSYMTGAVNSRSPSSAHLVGGTLPSLQRDGFRSNTGKKLDTFARLAKDPSIHTHGNYERWRMEPSILVLPIVLSMYVFAHDVPFSTFMPALEGQGFLRSI